MANVYLTLKPSKQEISHTWLTQTPGGIKGNEKRNQIYTWPRIGINTSVKTGNTNKTNKDHQTEKVNGIARPNRSIFHQHTSLILSK